MCIYIYIERGGGGGERDREWKSGWKGGGERVGGGGRGGIFAYDVGDEVSSGRGGAEEGGGG